MVKLAFQDHEDEIAKIFGGHKQNGTGNKWPFLGDVITESLSISCKCTDKKSIKINLDDFDEIRKIAFYQGKIPIICLRMAGRDFILAELFDITEICERAIQPYVRMNSR